ncbi:MAG: S1 RNA-binding domain-containing protein [Candidatus Margulisbacteria bacterium]|nr:S1 RNA-binding domain-containing protein [Candidatus Margulisiibacteriota bacterium]MBU1021165.1 S1 RNA-binding domain-containing protein [Candidatus Margulisiibacteriota bacterium]MBU1729771.1 S1 RNA-binding domain-containing protein [Candidatus Margulisiibacteriota bacterium]MBU1955272.1 S1 RNA-binding domain-containing protein [Candidatus Margulisiibacteriota bacterium]
MPVDIGTVVAGKITGITKFGAFVELPEGKVGLVHISQVAGTFVKDINEFVKIGDQVKVKVLGEPKPGKYDLSMKQAAEPSAPDAAGPPRPRPERRAYGKPKEMHPPGSFEDKITQFLKQSEEKLLDVKRNIQYKTGERKKGKTKLKKT